MNRKYDVIIIGSGVTGVGIARDLAMRGAKVILLERYDLASGATGRSHGLLHSGGRYVVKDPESAAECARENRILRKIAGHIIDDTEGLFVKLKEDSGDYLEKFLKGCKVTGVIHRELTRKETFEMEPNLSQTIDYVIKLKNTYLNLQAFSRLPFHLF